MHNSTLQTNIQLSIPIIISSAYISYSQDQVDKALNQMKFRIGI